MMQWPPSPFVEDEVDALANEHSLHTASHTPKSDDQPASSRGAVDQYPIIIDSPELPRSERAEVKQPKARQHLAADTSSSDDSTGPATPPPLFRKMEKRHSSVPPPSVHSVSSPVSQPSQSPPATTEQRRPSRGRPTVTRIQTDLGGDLHAMATGSRRPPSPYLYTRTPTFPDPSQGYPPRTESFFPPTYAMASPDPINQRKQPLPTPMSAASNRPIFPQDGKDMTAPQPRGQWTQYSDGPTTVREKQTPRGNPQIRVEPRSQTDILGQHSRQYYHELPSQPSEQSRPLSPPHSRRQSKESGSGLSSEERSNLARAARSRQEDRDRRVSPYTSSTEESSQEQRRRGNRSSEEERTRLRRKSSSRRDKPNLGDVDRTSQPNRTPASAAIWADSKGYRLEPRDRGQANSTTPAAGNSSKAEMEDRFARAFRENEHRRLRSVNSPRSSGSALASPISSPPRTPKSEQQRKDWLEGTPTIQRPVQRSRPPSADEEVMREFRNHSNMLSAATAGAARVSGISPKSSGTSTETGSSSSTSKAPSAPRSRRPSPILEDTSAPLKNGPFSPTNVHPQAGAMLTPTYEPRPGSRGNNSVADVSYPQPQSYRALSYSGPTHPQPWQNSNPPSAVSPTYVPAALVAAAVPMRPSPSFQSRSARSSVNTVELASPGTDAFGFPVCPRQQPMVGYNDWYTIKENADIDICPTCMHSIGSTRYRDLFVPSLPRPYNEPSFCVMSKPWVRVAFMQSMRQNKPNLGLIRDVMSTERSKDPCPKTVKDIRSWYQVLDPRAKSVVPNFFVCKQCTYAVDYLFQQVSSLIHKPKNSLNHEASCSLHTDSKHFHGIITEFERAEIRCKGRPWRSSEVEALIEHLRRVGRYQPCPKDELSSNRGWHIMPGLNEFTVCEGCYDEIIAPIQDRPIARDMSKVLALAPIPRTSIGKFSNSCQLYSDRMRKTFLDAVANRDLGSLKKAVRQRLEVQHRLKDSNRSFEEDLKYGIDRRPDIERNKQLWRSYE